MSSKRIDWSHGARHHRIHTIVELSHFVCVYFYQDDFVAAPEGGHAIKERDEHALSHHDGVGDVCGILRRLGGG